MNPILPVWRWGVASLLCLSACTAASPRAPALDSDERLVGAHQEVYSVPEWADREYILRLPPSYDGETAIPVVFGFHGGGGEKEGFVRTGCLDGDEAAENCLSALADREGFALVLPDGVDSPGVRKRSWNAGGGSGGWRCVGGEACATASDDVAYVDALLAEVKRAVRVDDTRIFATGMSNGAAMSHRLACERAEVFAAIAAVAGSNQALGAPGCMPSQPIPVLHIHGTEDRCWGYDGMIREPLCDDGTEGLFVDVDASMAGWRERNGCTGTTSEALPDAEMDGTRVTRIRGTGCAADTEHIQIEGGGHTWPAGWLYLAESRIGRVSRDVDGNAAIWAFFAAHPRTR
jgi:polyhydroxybutyrate depolymerase